MIEWLADAGIGPWPLRLAGRFHPAVVHFPIALIVVSAFLELLHAARRKPGTAPASVALVLLAALGAVAASATGWFWEEFDGMGGPAVETHKWWGLGTTGLAVVAAVFGFKAGCCPGALAAFRLLLIAGTGLVVWTGHLGGAMVHGSYVRGFNDPAPTPPPAPEVKTEALLSQGVDFAAQIAPIFKDHCLKCHSKAKKVKGKFEMDHAPGFFKGGNVAKDKVIVRGDPDKSHLFKLLLEPEPADRMPPDEDGPLKPEQIALIRRWIEAGAPWPEGFVIR
ncbi:MAG TPA: c-type cytochrome domain-containing protein [Planctomycetota bacterium]|nr:c-type cytochrome domain-containing protein [Planctomycetota bacterium]